MSAGRPARRHFLLKFRPEFHPARKRVDESLPPLLAGGLGRLQRRIGERRIVRQPGSDEQRGGLVRQLDRSEEHTSELQSLMRISYAVFCLKKKTRKHITH